jgi:hypothetical protein
MPLVTKLGAASARVKLDGSLIARDLAHKEADPIDRAASLLEHRGEDVPRVNHVGPHLQRDVDTGRSGALGDAKAVI